MHEQINPHEFDVGFRPVITPPICELMTRPETVAELWGEDSGLAEQVVGHNERVATVNACLDALPSPTTTLQQAVESGEVSSALAGQCYGVLSDILSESDYRRLVLYLPFELLPDADWKPSDAGLQEAAERFRKTYMLAWSKLLTTYDAEANFTNGDVIEPEYRDDDLSRVVKAAHLLPELLERGLIDERQIDQLAYSTTDPLLRASIDDAMAGRRDTLYDPNNVPAIAMTPARQAWISRVKATFEREQAAQKITETILAEGLQASLMQQSRNPDDVNALIEGIYSAIELTAQSDRPQATLIYEQAAELFQSSWNVEDVRPELARVYRKLYRLGFVEKTELDQHGVELSALSGQLSENTAYIKPDIQRVQELTVEFADDQELSQLIYPIAIVGGSRIKGYGEPSSDIDMAVFVRPGVDDSQRALIRQRVADLTGGSYELSEFWLETDNDGLRVRDIPGCDSHTARSDWSHSLFGNVWVGNGESIRELQTRLSPAYFDASRPDVRYRYIERIEQDMLQYRLLHSGYDRHYPRYSTRGHSAFWDAGYRQLATRLFVDKVFLPHTS